MNDADKLLAILKSSRNWENGWMSHQVILNAFYARYGHGATLNSRASDLRKRGYDVECRIERNDGRATSFYRLVTS